MADFNDSVQVACFCICSCRQDVILRLQTINHAGIAAKWIQAALPTTSISQLCSLSRNIPLIIHRRSD